MSAAHAHHAKALARAGEDALTFTQCERREGFVFQSQHAAACVVIAYPALERNVAAARRILHLTAQLFRQQYALTEKKLGFHPPATGGRNTTVSPSFSAACQSPNSSLTATRRDSLL